MFPWTKALLLGFMLQVMQVGRVDCGGAISNDGMVCLRLWGGRIDFVIRQHIWQYCRCSRLGCEQIMHFVGPGLVIDLLFCVFVCSSSAPLEYVGLMHVIGFGWSGLLDELGDWEVEYVSDASDVVESLLFSTQSSGGVSRGGGPAVVELSVSSV